MSIDYWVMSTILFFSEHLTGSILKKKYIEVTGNKSYEMEK